MAALNQSPQTVSISETSEMRHPKCALFSNMGQFYTEWVVVKLESSLGNWGVFHVAINST